jgi:hypothetical protein
MPTIPNGGGGNEDPAQGGTQFKTDPNSENQEQQQQNEQDEAPSAETALNPPQ